MTDMENLITELRGIIGTHEERHYHSQISPTGMGLVSKIDSVLSRYTPTTENKGGPPCKIDPSFNCDELTSPKTDTTEPLAVLADRNRQSHSRNQSQGEIMNGKLLAELRDLCDRYSLSANSNMQDFGCGVLEILNRHESLAELADRKGYCIRLIRNCRYPVGWVIHLQPKMALVNGELIEIPEGENVDTYAEAEAKACEFLMALPDGKENRL